jgi:hypothetical protein
MSTWFTKFGTEYTGKVHTVNEKKGTATYQEPHPCSRCGGAGGSDKWKFTGWKCFECGGSGHQGRTRTCRVYSPEAYAKLTVARAKRDAVKAAAQAVRNAAWEAKEAEKELARKAAVAVKLESFEVRFPGFAANLSAGKGENTFLCDLHTKLEYWGSLSEAQIGSAQKILDRQALTANAEYVAGKVGDRVTLTLTVDRVHIPETFGYQPIPPSWTYICHDEKGCVVVYRGRSNTMPYKDETKTIVASIKEFTVYNGVKQTVIARPSDPKPETNVKTKAASRKKAA